MQPAVLSAHDTLVLLDDPFAADGSAVLLESPERIVTCATADTVADALTAIEQGLADGLHAAGYVAYELGYLLEPALAALLPPVREGPLLWFGLFREPRRLGPAEVRGWLEDRAKGTATVENIRPAFDSVRYAQAFAQVREYIAQGDVYQINLTFPCRCEVRGDPFALYRDLRRRQRVICGGLIVAPDRTILSLSPEQFLQIEGARAQVRPMKGTAPRAPSLEADALISDALRSDIKSRAENLMIVDLMRNDLGRLALTGTVRVTDLFTVETYRTLHQLTSGIEAELQPGVSLSDLLRALFPCGSVTGAPKIRAMQIIRELEVAPRGVYTGAIGLISPDGRVALNVAIRTLTIGADGQGTMGIGSGVVFDSDAQAEYDECLLKMRFLADQQRPFALIETLRWDRDRGYALLDRHLARLKASADYFGIPCDAAAVRARLDAGPQGFGEGSHRVRLLLDEDGEITLTATPLKDDLPPALRFALASAGVDSCDPLLYHKTTLRAAYEDELARQKAATGCDEVVFVNERGELTEGSWTTLFVEQGGVLLTPPVASGLLPGTLRAELLSTGRARTQVLYPETLAAAEHVFLGNSVRGLMPAEQVA